MFHEKSFGEIYEMCQEDFEMLSQLLGDKEFILGNEVHLIDCTAFALVSVFLDVSPFDDQMASGFNSWLNEKAANLIRYQERIKEKFWPDWQSDLLKQVSSEVL